MSVQSEASQRSRASVLTTAMWIIILCGAGILTLNMGVRMALGLFLDPVSLDFGWSKEVFSVAMGIQAIIWGLIQPFSAAFADRYGTGKTLAIGGGAYAISLYLMTISGTPGLFTLTSGVIMGLAIGTCGFPLVLGAVARAVPAEKRSLALGIAGAGGSFGQFALPPLAGFLVTADGWIATTIVLALLAMLIIPLSFALRGKPDMGAAAAHIEQSLGQALKEAGTHRGYILLNIGFFVCGFHVMFVGTHLPSYLNDLGFTASVGGWAIGVIGFFNIMGSLIAGWLGDTYKKKNLLTWIYLGRAIVFGLFFIAPVTEISVYLFAGAIGFLWLSTVPLTGGLVGVMFGPRYMTTLFAIVMLSHQLGAFLGAAMGGWVFEATGSYDWMWILSIILGLVSAALHWPIPERLVDRPQPAAA